MYKYNIIFFFFKTNIDHIFFSFYKLIFTILKNMMEANNLLQQKIDFFQKSADTKEKISKRFLKNIYMILIFFFLFK